jgi:hypothetical protein
MGGLLDGLMVELFDGSYACVLCARPWFLAKNAEAAETGKAWHYNHPAIKPSRNQAIKPSNNPTTSPYLQ